MRLLVNLENTDEYKELSIENNDTVETLKYIIEAEFNVPFLEQELKCENVHLDNNQAYISAYKLKDDDLLLLSKKKGGNPMSNFNMPIGGGVQNNNINTGFNLSKVFDDTMKMIKSNPQPQGGSNNNMMKFSFDMRVKNESKAIKDHYLSQSDELSLLFTTDPELAEVVVSEDIQRLEDLVRKRMTKHDEKKKRELDEYNKLMSADPNDLEAQGKIEEMIRMKNVEENLKMAYEYLPESFSHINMLYINIEINKMVMTALVDTGAQSTIISEDLAKKCGIYNLCDKRYSGIAKGVGTTKIIGVIHAAQLKLGDQ